MTNESTRQPMQEIALRLDTYLLPLGFVRNRKSVRFYLSNPAHCVIAELQKSSKSTADTTVVAANIGIWSSTLAEKYGGPVSAKGLHAMDGHWWLRAGEFDDAAQERWWSVTNTDDLDVVANDIWLHLAPAVELFVQLTGDAEFLAYLLNTQPPFLDPMNRWAFALVLARALDNQEAQIQATHELHRISETRTLPIGQRWLLQSANSNNP